MAIPRSLNSLGRFSKNIIKHPGSWILASLIAVGIGFAVPVLAPALVIAAFLGTAIAAPIALIFQAIKWRNKRKEEVKSFGDFIKAHPFQFAAILLALALLVTALVLTIGFFTGGAGFLFMAPVFAAIAAPFATAATAWGISLSLPALAGLAGFCLTIAALNLPNTLKRFLGWLDSFKYDGAMAAEQAGKNNVLSLLADQPKQDKIDWSVKNAASLKVAELVTEEDKKTESYAKYVGLVSKGIFATVKNGLSSTYEDAMAEAEPKKRVAYERVV